MGVIHSWDCDSPFVRERMAKSLAIIQQTVPADFAGVFVEIGAHNGQFTKILLAAFQAASIAACDINRAAWDKAGPEGVTFQQCDMASFELPPQHRDKPAILLMMECLYYLSAEERLKALQHLRAEIPNLQTVFISGPLDGGAKYFDEGRLRRMFKVCGLKFHAAHVLNFRPAFHTRFSWDRDPILKWLSDSLEWRRRLWANRPAWCHRRRVNKLQTRLYEMIDKDLLDWRVKRLEAGKKKLLRRTDKSPRARRRYAHQVLFRFDPQ